MTSVAVWSICIASVAGVLVRPRRIGEWVWASLGAVALVALRLLTPTAALAAIARGGDVYLFLSGMMVLAELARREGVFDWVAGYAVRAANGSRARLFGLVYAACVAVTIVLSNDATAVVLTPAVAAAVRRAKAEPLPYLLACAFVANAASFVLPISNPANLVIFGAAMPPLGRWIGLFAVPSLLAIAATYAALRWYARRALAGTIESGAAPVALGTAGRVTAGGIVVAALALVAASAAGAPLGLVTALAGGIVFAGTAVCDRTALRDVARSVSWGVIPLVAGLFVLVAAVDATGFLAGARAATASLAGWPAWRAIPAIGLVTALASNLTNNLPAGLLAGLSLHREPGGEFIAGATAIGIDLGPNLSVTGSLATMLWLVALRREGIEVTAGAFLRIGAIVMPPALALALLGLLVVAR